MTHFKFVGRISSQGKNLIIWIPKEFHKDVKTLKGKQIKIILEDDFWLIVLVNLQASARFYVKDQYKTSHYWFYRSTSIMYQLVFNYRYPS